MMNKKTVEPVVTVVRTEQQSYIRADGEKVRKVKTQTTVVQLKRKDRLSKSDDEADVSIREDGKRVRKIRKFLQRKKSNKDTDVEKEEAIACVVNEVETSPRAVDDTTASTSLVTTTLSDSKPSAVPTNPRLSRKDSAVAVICENLEKNCSVRPQRAVILPSRTNDTISSTTSAATYSSATMTSSSTSSGGGGSVRPLDDDKEVEIYINEKGQKVRRSRRKIPKGVTNSDSSVGCKMEGETYVNEKGQTVRRVRKVRKKTG